MGLIKYLDKCKERARDRNQVLRLIVSGQSTLTSNSMCGDVYFTRNELLWHQYKNTFNTHESTRTVYLNLAEFD